MASNERVQLEDHRADHEYVRMGSYVFNPRVKVYYVLFVRIFIFLSFHTNYVVNMYHLSTYNFYLAN